MEAIVVHGKKNTVHRSIGEATYIFPTAKFILHFIVQLRVAQDMALIGQPNDEVIHSSDFDQFRSLVSFLWRQVRVREVRQVLHGNRG